MTATSPSLTTLRRRTVVSLLRTWREIKGSARQVLSDEIEPHLPDGELGALKQQMELCLSSPGGEVSARAHTAELGRIYLRLNEAGRGKFLKLLADAFDVDEEKSAAMAQSYIQAKAADRPKMEMALKQALTAPRGTILKQFTALPDGFKFLVNLRADLLPLIGKDIKLKGLEFDLKTILSSWFDIGLLDLVEITWNSPAALLEKLIEYEAVHKIKSWDDLKNRLDADRRVFAFFHNKMPLEPLIFVHVALVKGMSDNIQVLLDEKTPALDRDEADTAIFYSISNAQKGLAGISFGNFLIKRVVSQLTDEMPNLKTYATLSPIPGFRQWLDPLLIKNEGVLSAEEMKTLRRLNKESDPTQVLYQLLESDWIKEAESLKPILMRLCAQYLLNEKKQGKPLDPVANFHIFNGARLERLNWLGDTSSKGMKQSAGIMANYYYKLSDIDENHEAFVADGKIVAGKQVKGYVTS